MGNGIYAIVCISSNRIYIGQAKDTTRRITRHKMWLRHNTHFSKELQDDWNKYGENYFFFKKIEENKEFDEEMRLDKEKFWIDFYINDKNYDVYNVRYEGHHFSEEGRKRVSESSKKMSKENHPMWGKKGCWKDKKRPEGFGKQISESLMGHKVSDESKKKMSDAKKGKEPCNKFPLTPELLDDIQKGLTHKEFVEKYNMSQNTYYRIKKELKTKSQQ